MNARWVTREWRQLSMPHSLPILVFPAFDFSFLVLLTFAVMSLKEISRILSFMVHFVCYFISYLHGVLDICCLIFCIYFVVVTFFILFPVVLYAYLCFCIHLRVHHGSFSHDSCLMVTFSPCRSPSLRFGIPHHHPHSLLTDSNSIFASGSL